MGQGGDGGGRGAGVIFDDGQIWRGVIEKYWCEEANARVVVEVEA